MGQGDRHFTRLSSALRLVPMGNFQPIQPVPVVLNFPNKRPGSPGGWHIIDNTSMSRRTNKRESTSDAVIWEMIQVIQIDFGSKSGCSVPSCFMLFLFFRSPSEVTPGTGTAWSTYRCNWIGDMELYIYISLWYTHAIMLYTCTHTVYIYCMYIYIYRHIMG